MQKLMELLHGLSASQQKIEVDAKQAAEQLKQEVARVREKYEHKVLDDD